MNSIAVDVLITILKQIDIMEIKFMKRHVDAKIPTLAKLNNASFYLTAVKVNELSELHIEYDTCISVEIPKGYYGMFSARPDILKMGIIFADGDKVLVNNSAAAKDTIKVKFKKKLSFDNSVYKRYSAGDVVATFTLIPQWLGRLFLPQ